MPSEKNPEKPLTLSVFKETLSTQLIQFYNNVVEPSIRNIVSEELQSFRHEMNQRFDFLFKKFEDLRQEYIIVKHQMERSDEFQETIKKEVVVLKSKIANLQKEVDELERRLQPH